MTDAKDVEIRRLKQRVRKLVYGRLQPHDRRMTERAFDGGAPLSESEIEVLHSMQRQGQL